MPSPNEMVSGPIPGVFALQGVGELVAPAASEDAA